MCIRSRSGFIITLRGAPITWGSKLQMETALSTMEAEYIALSMAMRELLPTKALVEEVLWAFNIQRNDEARIYKVWEDNNGALALANLPLLRLMPRSKHLAVKYRWFKERIANSDGTIQIKKVESEKQKADIFTKSFPCAKFEELRHLVCGW